VPRPRHGDGLGVKKSFQPASLRLARDGEGQHIIIIGGLGEVAIIISLDEPIASKLVLLIPASSRRARRSQHRDQRHTRRRPFNIRREV